MKQNYDNEENRQSKARKTFCKVQDVRACSDYQHSSLPKPPSSSFLAGTLLDSDFTFFFSALFSSFTTCFPPCPCVPRCSQGHRAGRAGTASLQGTASLHPWQQRPDFHSSRRISSVWSLGGASYPRDRFEKAGDEIFYHGGSGACFSEHVFGLSGG